MSDNKNMQDGRDRSRISGSDDYEVQYLAGKMNVSADAVREAIEKVGSDRQKVEDYLCKKQ